MFSRYVVAVVLVCLGFGLKETKASPTGVVQEVTPEIVELKNEVEAALRDAGLAIGEMYSSLDLALDEARNNVYTELNKLRDQGAVVEEDSDLNVECKTNLTKSLNLLDVSFISTCADKQNYASVSIRMAVLGRIKSQIYVATSACFKPKDEATADVDEDEVRECVSNTVASLRKKTRDTERDLGDQITSFNNVLQTCLQEGQVKVLGDMKDVSDEFDNCTKA